MVSSFGRGRQSENINTSSSIECCLLSLGPGLGAKVKRGEKKQHGS